MNPPLPSKPRDPRVRRLLERLFRFGEDEWFLGRDAVEGIFIVGATGSGKSTGSARAIFRSMIGDDYGGLYLTSKPDDLRMLATDYFVATGRSPREDIVVIQPEQLHPSMQWPVDVLGPPHRFRFNVLRYEFERGGGLTSNVVDVLHAATTSREGNANRDPFWDEALRELILHAVDLIVLSTLATLGRAEIRLDDVLEVIASAPVSLDDAKSSRFRSGRCFALISVLDGARDKLSAPRFRDAELTCRYWLQQFPGLAEETRSSIVVTFTAKVQGLLRSPLRELLCGESDEEVLPDRSFNVDRKTGRPKVIVVNLPVKLYQGVGRFAQTLIKTVWQRAAERRIASIDADAPGWCPAFLGGDEFQNFITSQDALFQQTARSAMVATVCLTQNLPNFYAAIGEQGTQSFLGNLQTKIFHAQGDPATNEWAERVFGSELQGLRSEPLTGNGSPSLSYSYVPILPAARFTELKKGGWHDDARIHARVGAYVFQAGRQWNTKGAERHYHEFDQGS